ncbi:gamma-glutamyltranspeptidase/glutathione hydrolase [Altererythrobacter atlanticus]|uniref:Glutathione hydrolase proenzyme n=1 Tax=Croceibacterium atlanticum TaxID=1267766 RepID=A0A0F7KVU0_9SPHN|nr:gamma-glutamyltransferase [Croceibacterium atlanticum]AKH43296.1 Gamma-glutamyltranspeptidase precursor [Croceibacterium atlanticum]MBB5731998.1 gamma-glutamyltranspeptidase/glutathione hydrolase [Croceibacterium atlanticum]
MLHRTLAFIAAPLLLAGCTTTLPPESTGTASKQRADTLGLVSAADPRAAQAGATMLRNGGSATDAAIATMLALTVVEPQSSGIGGGGFYVRGEPDGTVTTIDGRETAPAQAGPDWFLDAGGNPVPFPDAVLSGLSIGVPGNLRLAAQAHEKYGKLPWSELFQPAIALARDGFSITERFHQYLGLGKGRADKTEFGKALFYDDAGEPLPVGTTIRNPQLAETLQRIAERGPDTFYDGPHGEELASAIAAYTPGDDVMAAADLTSYEAKWRDPVCGEYRSYRICGMGPPSSGATTVYAILKQLEHFDLTALGPDSPVSWHLFAESQRLAYADREIYLGDSDYVQVPVKGLTDPDYLAARGSLISASHSLQHVEAGKPAGVALNWADGEEPAENGTSHFVAVDREGNIVSYTSTVEGPFGSGLTFGGFYLNNELTDFSLVPEKDGHEVANRVEGGKRPRSSMAPTVVYDAQGRLVIAVGAAGGGTIPVQVAKALIGMLDWGLSAQDAIALPGLYSPGDTVAIEPGSALVAMKPQLEALGHKVIERQMPFKANAAQWVDGRWVGAADPRSEGSSVSE